MLDATYVQEGIDQLVCLGLRLIRPVGCRLGWLVLQLTEKVLGSIVSRGNLGVWGRGMVLDDGHGGDCMVAWGTDEQKYKCGKHGVPCLWLFAMLWFGLGAVGWCFALLCQSAGKYIISIWGYQRLLFGWVAGLYYAGWLDGWVARETALGCG